MHRRTSITDHWALPGHCMSMWSEAPPALVATCIIWPSAAAERAQDPRVQKGKACSSVVQGTLYPLRVGPGDPRASLVCIHLPTQHSYFTLHASFSPETLWGLPCMSAHVSRSTTLVMSDRRPRIARPHAVLTACGRTHRKTTTRRRHQPRQHRWPRTRRRPHHRGRRGH